MGRDLHSWAGSAPFLNRLAFIEDGLGHNVQRQAGVRHGSASSRHPGDQLMDIPMQAVRNSEPNARLRRHIGRVKTGSTHAGVARIHVCSTGKRGSGTCLSSAIDLPLYDFQIYLRSNLLCSK